MTVAHTGLSVSEDKLPEVLKWYEAALAPLGYKVAMSFMDGKVVGFSDKPFSADWWIRANNNVAHNTHHAFLVNDRATVDAFHAAAVAAGGKDNGAPGPRPQSGPTYYAAYVYDPAGNNIEAVCVAPPSQ